jgi:hypothetical protein
MPIMFDYQRRVMIEAVGLNSGTPQAARGLWWLNRWQGTDGGSGWVTGHMRYNNNYRYDLLAPSGVEAQPTALSYDASGAGVVFARSDWTTSASWLHIMAGKYDQSHAHQDQGGFSFFKGKYLSVTSNTLSNSGINQGTDIENVLRFDNGSTPVPQNNSTSTKTLSDSNGVLDVLANLTPAYSSNSSKVSKWTREFTYTRSTHTLKIHDICTVGSGITPVFQVHVPVQPVKQADGSYLAGALKVSPASDETGSVVSMPSVNSDVKSGYRLELRASSCEFTVTLQAQ